MDEATLFKFGKWVEDGRFHPTDEKFPLKGTWSGSRDCFWYEATLFKFRKCMDWRVPHQGLTIPPKHSIMSIVWCLSSRENLVQISVIITEIDAPDVHLMTSREWTSGFDFWSCGQLCMTVMHLPTKFGTDTFIQSGVIDIFRNSRWRPPPSWIFNICEFGHSVVLIVRCFSSIPNLVQISVIVTEIDAILFPTFIWWRHENKLPVSTFGHVVIVTCMAVTHPPTNFGAKISISSPELLTFFRNSRWRPPPSCFPRYVNLAIP